MQDTPGFLSTFFGSLFNFSKYTDYVKRGGGSMFAHFFLVITLSCALYAGVTQVAFTTNVAPFLNEFAGKVPAISITDGKATVDIPQPYLYKEDGKVLAVIDTTQPPDTYLKEYDSIVILSEDKFIIKENSGKVESYELPQKFSLTSSEVKQWIDRAQTWVFPSIFLLCFLWQFCWKAVQVLIAATVVTLVQSSRPDFYTHWKLANLALMPAMMFGVIVYAVNLNSGQGIPGAGFLFWGILGGLTYYASDKLRKSPVHS